MKPQIFLAFFIFSSCGQTKNNPQSGSKEEMVSTQKPNQSIWDYSPKFENAHPNAQKLMNEEFYFSTIEETAPFGNDDGSDTYANFKDWRQLYKNGNPVDFLNQQIRNWGYPLFDINEKNINRLKLYLKQTESGSRYMSGIDAAIVAIAFGQLYLEGTVDKSFKAIAITAIERELIPEMLALWGESYKIVRKSQLRKMLQALKRVN